MRKYKTFIFDCDGVVLNSNAVKTSAFRSTAEEYGVESSDALVEYHIRNGGISRYRKFDYFLRSIVGTQVTPLALDSLVSKYAKRVRRGLLECEIAPGLEELRLKTPGVRWLLASGGDQAELREVFAARRIDLWFDGGIFGSPDSKEIILSREIANENAALPALFFGDSRYDHVAATGAGLDFAFVSGWTEFELWPKYFSGEVKPHFLVHSISEFLVLQAESFKHDTTF